MRDGELLLIDAATSFAHYSSDVTRTFPVNGKFTPEQREIYQIVRDAQEAFVRQIKPGVGVGVASDSGKAVVAKGLVRLGLIQSAEATIDPPAGARCAPGTCQQVSCMRCTVTVGTASGSRSTIRRSTTRSRTQFGVGDVFTVEPGIYVSPDLLGSLPDTPKNRAFLAKIQARGHEVRRDRRTDRGCLRADRQRPGVDLRRGAPGDPRDRVADAAAGAGAAGRGELRAASHLICSSRLGRAGEACTRHLPRSPLVASPRQLRRRRQLLHHIGQHRQPWPNPRPHSPARSPAPSARPAARVVRRLLRLVQRLPGRGDLARLQPLRPLQLVEVRPRQREASAARPASAAPAC